MRLTICLILIMVTETTFPQTGNFTSSNLPIVIINTLGQDVKDDPKIPATMGIIYNGTGVRNLLSDPYNNYNGNIGIEYRGQSSQSFAMKSYGIELRDTANGTQEKSILGIAKESDWILYAPYTDKTLMRNVLAYTLSNRLGHWASQCRYVELVVNNEYRGIYVLMEKIKRGNNRVVINKIGTGDNTGDAVTGGYIISLDKDPAAFTSNYLPPNAPGKQIRFCNVYPKADKITPQQNDYIKNYVDSFETALNGASFQDEQTGVRKYAELSSFIDYFLINELSHNVDGYRLSTYLYKDKSGAGGKLTIGPVWDYDLAFRNANYCNGSSTNTWAYQFNATCPDDYWQIPFWWNKLMTDTAFVGNLKCRYTDVEKTIFSINSIHATIDSIQQLLSEAQVRHFTKWPILGQYIWPNPLPIPTAYADEIATLKNWIALRNNWLGINIPNKGTCATNNGPATNNGISLTISPNPMAAGGKIILTIVHPKKVNIVISNAIGQTVFTGCVNASAGDNYLQNIDFIKMQNGIYFIKAYTDTGENATKKIVMIR